jgi:hypothetical protein
MDLITGVNLNTPPAEPDGRADETALDPRAVPPATLHPADVGLPFIEADATPGGTPMPTLHGPAAEPVEPIRGGASAGRWALRVVPAALGSAAAVTWAVLRARRR